MGPQSSMPRRPNPYILSTRWESNGSKSSPAPYYIMCGPLTTRFLCISSPLVLISIPPLNAPWMPSYSYLTTLPHTQMTESPTVPEAWSSQGTIMSPFLMKAYHADEQEPTYLSLNMYPSKTTTVHSSLSPKPSKFSCPLQMNRKLWPSSSPPRRFPPSAKFSSKWDVPNQCHPFKMTTEPLMGSQTIPSSPNAPKP